MTCFLVSLMLLGACCSGNAETGLENFPVRYGDRDSRKIAVTGDSVYMLHADCANQDCVNMGAVTRDNLDDEDIENLIIQQIEFCDIILLNKVDQVSEEELKQIKAVVRAIQPTAKVVECTFADVPLQQILDTHSFNFDKASLSAAWIKELGKPIEDEEESEEEEEYGIGTFVYYRRRPFDINKFDRFVIKHWPTNIIRTKGICWFTDNNDMSYLFEQSGKVLLHDRFRRQIALINNN